MTLFLNKKNQDKKNTKNIKNTRQIIYNILKLYVYVLVFLILLTLILLHNNVIYLDSSDYNIIVKVEFKGITYNVKGIVLNELFYDKGGYFCFILACHIVYGIALKDNLWNQPFKSDFTISRTVAAYKNTMSGTINTELVNDHTVDLIIENFNMNYCPEIKPGENIRRRFMRIINQIIGKPNLQDIFFVDKGSEPGSYIIKGLLQNTNSSTVLDSLWDRLQHRECVVQFSNSSSTELVLSNINSPLEQFSYYLILVIVLIFLLLFIFYLFFLFFKK